MNDLTTYLERRAHASNAERLLLTEDGLTIAATAGLGMSHYNELNEMQHYRQWQEEFSDAFGERMTVFEERRVEQLSEYEPGLSEELRHDDVQARWDFEQFFAEEGDEGAKRVLGYYSYEGGQSQYHVYTEAEYEQLLETGRVEVDDETLEGHHIMDVSSHASDPAMHDQLHDVDNIRIITQEAHLHDPEFGHGGDWSNTTTGETSEVTSRFEDITTTNREIADENIAWFNLCTGIGVGFAVGAISAAIEIYRLKDDPRPWKQRAVLISMTTLVRGFEAGSLALVALNIRTAISSTAEDQVLQSQVEYVNNFLSEIIPGDVVLDAGNLAAYTGFTASIATLRMIRSGIVSVTLWRQNDLKTAWHQFSSDTKVILIEESAFWSAAFILDAFWEFGEDTLIPDPAGFIILLRIIYSGGKKFKQSSDERNAIKECKQRQLDGLYESSIAALVYLG